MIKTGIGFDFHRLGAHDKPLVIGGVEIPGMQGCIAHSDGDVFIHALIDALVGPCHLPDIGQMFPDNQDKWKNASSLSLLKEVKTIIDQKNFHILNIDAIILLEKPALFPFYPAMKKNIAEILNLENQAISIKAKTMEGIGFVGKGKGIAALVNVLVSD